MTGSNDQEPTAPASGPVAEDLAAMVRVLEQRRRDLEGQARLAEEGRRRHARERGELRTGHAGLVPPRRAA
jgi:hypothetical protein